MTAETLNLPSSGLSLHARMRHCAEDAPTLVLLSGLGFHTFEYEPLAVRLAGEGLNCLSFDYRGHGRSGGRRGAWTLDELADDTHHAIDWVREHHSGPVALFGNSLGAMVAILTAARDDRVRATVASNCPARIADFVLTPPRRALFALAKLAGSLAPIRVSVDHFYAYEQLIEDRSWVATIRADPLIAPARRLSIPTLAELLDRWDGPDAVRAVHTPLLVLQGRNDCLQPVRQSELLFEAANEPKAYRPLATGHLPQLEDPGSLARVLVEWLGSLAELQ